MYDPYWKNNGPRSLQFHHNLSPIQHGNSDNFNINDGNTNPFATNRNNNSNNNNNNNNNMQYKHGTHDSTELNMLPMIKEDPTTNRIYRASRVVHNQHNIRERHKRSASMSVVKFSIIVCNLYHLVQQK